MNEAKQDYNRRKQEINKYFEFLELMDQRPSFILYTNILSSKESKANIDDDLIKILKANGFILLYNLTESTIVKSLKAIFNRIVDDNLTFQELSENIKKLWINNKSAPLKGLEDINLNKIRDLMRNIAESILSKEIAYLETSCLSISGNLDAQSIRSIAAQIGFESVVDGRDLLTIKTKRNHLAHGEFSFCDIGKDYSVNDLLNFKTNVFDHLESVMINIEAYILANKYSC